MYILMEKWSSDDGDSIHDYDALGHVASEEEAIKWVQKNPEYRIYKYCPA